MRIFLFTITLFSTLCLNIYQVFPQEADILVGTPHPEITKSLLDNGLTAIIQGAPGAKIASIDIRVRAGSTHEAQYSGSGIAHLVEHMIFKGTAKRGPAQIEKEIRSYGGVINGTTTFDYAAYTVTIPTEYFSSALDALSDCLFNSVMDQRELAREKGVILKEIRLNKDDPARYISQLLWSTVFITHPYRNPVIGYESPFSKLTQQDVVNFYKKRYVPNNMVIVIVGDVKQNEAMDQIKKYFGQIERRPLEEMAQASERPQTSKRTLAVEKNLEMAYFAMGYHSVDLYDPDMAALDVLSAILGQGESSRLNAGVYRQKQLVYSIGSWNFTPQDPGIFIISGMAAPKKLDAVLAAIGEEIVNLKMGSIDDAELARSKAIITTSYVFALETLAGRADDLASNEIATGDPAYMKTYIEKISVVTKEDVKRAAERYLGDESLSVVTLGPSVNKGRGETKTEDITRNIEKFTLPNGMRCLLLEDHDVPTVTMLSCCLGGLIAETQSTAGISNLTALMMTKGTETRSEESISSLTESMGASLEPFSGYNSLGIQLDIMSKDIDKGLELFKDVLLNPGFPQGILERERNRTIARINSVDDDIFDSGIKTFSETLFDTHPYRFPEIGIVDSVEDMKRDDLEAFYKKYFVPDNMVLAVYGDIDANKIRQTLTADFSALEKGPRPWFTEIKEPRQNKIKQKEAVLEKEQSLIILGFQGTTLASRDRYVLQLITTALSGVSGSLSALFRERLGIAYAVGAYSIPAVDPGYVALYILTTSDQIDTAKKGLLNQIIALNKNGLSKEEIGSTKRELIGNHRIALQTNSALAHQTALDELYGLGFGNYTKFGEMINSITNEDIINASKKYLNPNAYTLVIIKGEPDD